MSEPFDPYSQWLGIEPHEVLVDHYRLLGVTRFEQDVEMIAQAADERMTYVRSLQTGPRGGFTQALLNELATARVCLLNPPAKASYDQMLEGMLRASQPPPAPAHPPAITTSPVDAPVVVEADDPEQASRPWALGVMVGVMVVGLGAVIILAAQWFQTQTTLDFEHGLSNTTASRELVVGDWEEVVDSVVVYQEGNGSVNFDAAFAQLHGPSITREQMSNLDVLTRWESMDDWVSWKFKIVKLPPQGVFLVRVTYAARPASDGGSFVLAVGEQEKECEIRGTGEPVTDEYYLAVPSTGEHTLTVRAKSKPSDELMTLKSVTFVQSSHHAPRDEMREMDRR
ncbi:MAG: hypothetical protein CMJ64_01065 [Planctomycetaceae bacterium]|nr:hypothetical protein [Planctomycetaceae bacterium]